MTIDRETLRITVVSADTKLLHEVAWMLSAVGYEVDTSHDFDSTAMWRRYADFDVLVVDCRSFQAPVEPVLAHDSHKPVYRIVLYDASSPPDFSAWHAAGANDAIGSPMSRGELLTRIRSGARYLEFERRLKRQSSRCQIPGLYSRRGFVSKLARLTVADPLHVSQHTLLVTGIDWFHGIVVKGGENAAERAVATAMRAIRSSAGESAAIAYVGDGRFLTLLPRQAAHSAKSIAERVAADFGRRECESHVRSTLTTAIFPWLEGDTPEQLIEAGIDAFTIARQSGGDCVLERGEFAEEFAAWTNEIAAGNPFADVVAQDIMEYFPAVLTTEGNQPSMIAALRRSGVPVCPYVDCNGRLNGIASAEDAVDTLNSSRLAALPIQQPETIENYASFSEIYEAFSTRGCSTLIVVADDHPIGYLTFHGFLSLVEPVGRDTFAGAAVTGEDSRQLVVPSLLALPD